MPTVELIDMRQEFLETRKQSTFSRRLLEAIGQRLEIGEQTMLLLNRRGFSSFVACRSCGERVQCVNCAVTLTFHAATAACCATTAATPSACPALPQVPQRAHLLPRDRLASAWRRNCTASFPRRASRAWTATPSPASASTRPFSRASARAPYDILVGTQMIAKGHDIPTSRWWAWSPPMSAWACRISAPPSAPSSCSRRWRAAPDAAACPAIVLVQTINPDHYAIRFAAAQDYAGFYEKELQFRRLMRYPPFSALANVLVRSEKKETPCA
jgi:primosomal protein N' (replication factor Y)